jgi:hypothetical protein
MKLSLSVSVPVLIFACILLAVLIVPVMGAMMDSEMLYTDLYGPNMNVKNVAWGDEGLEECKLWCENTPGCSGATWVGPGVQSTSARCWIKSEVSQVLYNKDCCISWIQLPAEIRSSSSVSPHSFTEWFNHNKPTSATTSPVPRTTIVWDSTIPTYITTINTYTTAQTQGTPTLSFPLATPFIAMGMIILFMILRKKRDI